MNLHPEIATALIGECEREALRRAEQHRTQSRRVRPMRSAPWNRSDGGRASGA